MGRLEAGRETVHDKVVSLRELRDEVSAVISPLAEARGLAFTLSFVDAPDEFIADPRKLRQVLLNLLGNSVKFTAAGSVTLTVAESGETLAFTELDATSTREQGGTGLGLTITKRLVALMDGSIRVEDKEGGGSSFVVTLPARRVATI